MHGACLNKFVCSYSITCDITLIYFMTFNTTGSLLKVSLHCFVNYLDFWVFLKQISCKQQHKHACFYVIAILCMELG